MAILGAMIPINGVLDRVTGLVDSARRPSLKSQDFASVLKTRMQVENDPAALRMRAEKARNDADASAHKFLKVRDYNNDQLLTQDESGMQAAAFMQMDMNKDGRLSLEEIKKPQLDAIARAFPDGASRG